MMIQRFFAISMLFAGLMFGASVWADSSIQMTSANPILLASANMNHNPCAKGDNPCSMHNPCDKGKHHNPCAKHNPCSKHNPCAMHNPCSKDKHHNPCAMHNPCDKGKHHNPCAKH